MEKGKKHFIFPKHANYMEEKELPIYIYVLNCQEHTMCEHPHLNPRGNRQHREVRENTNEI